MFCQSQFKNFPDTKKKKAALGAAFLDIPLGKLFEKFEIDALLADLDDLHLDGIADVEDVFHLLARLK